MTRATCWALGLAAAASSAQAEPAPHEPTRQPAQPASTRQPAPPATASPAPRWSLGAAITAYEEPATTWALAPELAGRAHHPLAPGWSASGGLRAWYRGLTQPEMPGGLGLVERDLGGAVELAVRRDWLVTPALALGGSLTRRTIARVTAPEIDAGLSMLDHTEWLPGLHAQVGVGLPVDHGRFLLEPYLRYEWLPDDDRVRLRWGLELSILLGAAPR
jgi:hypothetical protein